MRTMPPKKKVSKVLKTKLKHRSKSTKAKIERLDRDTKHFDDVSASLMAIKKTKSVLSSKELKEDKKRDEQAQEKNKQADDDLTKQLELITGIEL